MALIDSSTLYRRFRVKLKYKSALCGGVPKQKDIVRKWLESRTGHSDATTDKQEKEALENIDLDEEAEKSWNGFFVEKGHGVWVPARNVKAMFKECASVLNILKEKRGSKQVMQHAFEVKSIGYHAFDRIPVMRNGEQVRDADGYYEQPIHVTTAQGPRTAIKRVDYIENAEIEFEVWVLATNPRENRHVGLKELTKMLALGQENGCGADRSQGYGKFEVLELDVLDGGGQGGDDEADGDGVGGGKKKRGKR